MKKFNSQLLRINSKQKIVHFFFEVNSGSIAKVSSKRNKLGDLEIKISFLDPTHEVVFGYKFPVLPIKKNLKSVVHTVFKQIEQALFNE